MTEKQASIVTWIICLIVIGLIFLSSCKTKTIYVPVEEKEIVKETLRDTIVEILLVPYKDSVSINDTISHLENPYAYSWAQWKNGILSHSLGIKDFEIPVKIKYVDKEVIREKKVPYLVPGETVYLSEVEWYHEFSMWFTSIILVLTALYLGIKHRGKIISFFRKLIFKI